MSASRFPYDDTFRTVSISSLEFGICIVDGQNFVGI